MEKIIEIGSGVVCALSLALFFVKNTNVKMPQYIQRFLRRLELNEKTNKMLINMFLGTSIVALVGCWESEHAEQQIKIENRDTAANFRIEKTNRNLNYEMLWEKGMASSVTFNQREQYNFIYGGEDYQINFLFYAREKEQRNSISEEQPKLEYEVEDTGFNKEQIYEKMSKNVEERLGEKVIIGDTEEIEVDFFDYQNEYFSFIYHNDSTGINLTSADKNRYVPEYNVTMFVTKDSDFDVTIQDALDQVLKTEYRTDGNEE